MILCIFEGKKREPQIFETIKKLYFENRSDTIICTFGNNIYNLYQEMTKSDFTESIITILQEKLQKIHDTSLVKHKDSDFAEVFLFFDYDCHHQNKDKSLSLEEKNNQIKTLLEFFNNETENGKMYINYPMVESIGYTKKLPDKNYYTYTIPLAECNGFKECTNKFSNYKNLDFIILKKYADSSSEKTIKENWEYIKKQNIEKAYFICTGMNTIPKREEEVLQEIILLNQIEKFVEKKNEVSILNSFPLFLYEYFGK